MAVIKAHSFIICISFIFFLNAHAQVNTEKAVTKDSAFVNSLIKQAKEFNSTNPDKALELSVKAKSLAEEIGFLPGKAYALKNIGMAQYFKGNYIETLDIWQESLSVFEQIKDETGIANMLSNMASIYTEQGNEEKGLDYALRSLSISEKIGNKLRILTALNVIGSIYNLKEATKPKALEYLLRALTLSEEIGDSSALGTISGNIGQIYLQRNDYDKAITYFEKSIREGGANKSSFANNGLGNVYLQIGDYAKASIYHKKGLSIAENYGSKPDMIRSLDGIANIYKEQKDYKTALEYYHRASAIAEEIKAAPDLKDIYNEIAMAYSELSDYKNAFKYHKLYADIKDTLYNIDIDKRLGRLQFDFDLKKKDSEITLLEKDKALKDEELKREKLTKEVFMAGLVFVFLIALLIYRNYRQKKKANGLLQQQKEKVESTLTELKSTQAQLIQSEKMASLGELTAGIAHEIQNPLNFVNNFSEVNKELIAEMKSEIVKGNFEEVKLIADDVEANSEKINHHGKRAGDIVKGMLQHSRTSTGKKEPTDINALCDEYLRLSYHGLRAKDKTFNAKFETDFDDTIGKINIIPQDMGRVILNLINNAFYAVGERRKAEGVGYEPTVIVSTKKLDDKIEIRVRDNGNGIPHKIVDKIFQPFFTTKPTGQGTGLGLSLSYDIVKAHGGEIKVESKSVEDLPAEASAKSGSEFIIVLPINK